MTFEVFPVMRADQDLDCTDEEWAAFIKQVEEMGDKEIEQVLERQQKGTPEPPPVAVENPGLLYYWNRLMDGGDDS